MTHGNETRPYAVLDGCLVTAPGSFNPRLSHPSEDTDSTVKCPDGGGGVEVDRSQDDTEMTELSALFLGESWKLGQMKL